MKVTTHTKPSRGPMGNASQKRRTLPQLLFGSMRNLVTIAHDSVTIKPQNIKLWEAAKLEEEIKSFMDEESVALERLGRLIHWLSVLVRTEVGEVEWDVTVGEGGVLVEEGTMVQLRDVLGDTRSLSGKDRKRCRMEARGMEDESGGKVEEAPRME